MATAKSKKQQMAAGAALSAKRGERPKSSLKGASKGMAESMSEDELEAMASVKRKKLPVRNRAKTAVRKSSTKKSSARKSGTRKAAARKITRRKSSARKR
jgi:hypothetical protein